MVLLNRYSVSDLLVFLLVFLYLLFDRLMGFFRPLCDILFIIRTSVQNMCYRLRFSQVTKITRLVPVLVRVTLMQLWFGVQVCSDLKNPPLLRTRGTLLKIPLYNNLRTRRRLSKIWRGSEAQTHFCTFFGFVTHPCTNLSTEKQTSEIGQDQTPICTVSKFTFLVTIYTWNVVILT